MSDLIPNDVIFIDDIPKILLGVPSSAKIPLLKFIEFFEGLK